MTGAELLLRESNSQELAVLREFVEIIASMDCLVSWDESPEDCGCPTCAARECLKTVETLQELYSPHNA
jgi:hypothetical protein